MSRFFWRVYFALLGVVVLFFAVSSALFVRRDGLLGRMWFGQERS